MLSKAIHRATLSPVSFKAKRWRLALEYSVSLGGDDLLNPIRIVIEPGYITDGASVPWCFRWLLNPEALGLEAPLLHDWIIDKKGYVFDHHGNPTRISRADADEIFRLAMISSGIPQWRAVIAYTGVRLWAIVNRLEFSDQ
jgi:hypothetical protein